MADSTKTVVITGASSGFGEGAVRAFADRGYRVWGTMRDTMGRNAGKRAALQAHSSHVTIIQMPQGTRPTRTVFGMALGVDQINSSTQPLQDAVLKEMQLNAVLKGVSP